MRKYKQEIIWQEIEQAANNLIRLNIIDHDKYDTARHELRRAIRTAFERIQAREKHINNLLQKQIHNDGKNTDY